LGSSLLVLEQDNRFLQSVLLDVVGEFPQFAIGHPRGTVLTGCTST
jgi:hypothetical protein